MYPTSISPSGVSQPLQLFRIVTLAVAALVLALTTSTNARAQSFSVLHDFRGTSAGDGANPTYSGIVAQGRDGNMYGTTLNGGLPNRGTVFQVTPAGVLTVIYSFPGDDTGYYPFGGLTLGTDGNFYGTTESYGLPTGSTFGSVFKITPGGSLTYLYIFTGGSDGRYPTAPPIQGTDGNWYGTTQGDFSNPGSVYKLTSSGTFTTLHQFVMGEQPKDPVVQATDGNFYGTTTYGGTSNEGTVFRITPSGKLTVLYNFDSTHGAFPYAPLIQRSDGNFYGTTTTGGSAGGGVLYGTTNSGGTFSRGTVFKLDPAGTVTVLHSFGGGADGAFPTAGLNLDKAGNLYGATQSGGTFSVGTVFKVDPSGAETVLYNFTGGTDGANPSSAVTRDPAGNLYGTTYFGGEVRVGVVFKLDPAGTETVLHSFMGGRTEQIHLLP